MFGIGMPELLLILGVALIVIGPKKLPDLAKSLGRALNEFKRATSEIKESIGVEYDLKDVKKTFDELNQELKKPASPPSDAAEGVKTAPHSGTSEDLAQKAHTPHSPATPEKTDLSQSDPDEPEEVWEAGTDIPAELQSSEPELPETAPNDLLNPKVSGHENR